MKIDFTSASKKDGNKVTTRLSQFGEHPYYDDCVPNSLLRSDTCMLVTILHGRSTYLVAFRPNRFTNETWQTAITNNWPRNLRLPKVGKPVTYKVIGVTYV